MNIGKFRYETPMCLDGWKVKSVPANCVVRIKSRKQRFSLTKNHKALLSLTFTTLFYLRSTKNAAEIRVLVSINFTKKLRTCASDLQMSQQDASNAF